MFPVQTAMIRYGLDIEDMEQAWGMVGLLG